MKNPFLKFYTSDWRADPVLRMCSIAARGLWLEMICLMHEATPYGQLLVNGQTVTDTQLGALVGAPPDQITALLGELEAAGVFSRTRTGVIYSRKLTRMAKKVATARNNGRKGGNPSLRKQTENKPLDKGLDKGAVKPQKPEARYQIKEDDDDDSASAILRGPFEGGGDREAVLIAIGADPISGLTGPGGHYIGRMVDMQELKRWQCDLGLALSEVVGVIKEVMRRKPDGPPSRFSYFTKPMQQFAALKSQPALKPTEREYHEYRSSEGPAGEHRSRKGSAGLARSGAGRAHENLIAAFVGAISEECG